MNNKGFTIVEVMVAITVLAIGMLAVSTMQVNSIGGNSLARTVTSSTNFAAQQIEILLGMPYADPNLFPGDLNPAPQPSLNDSDNDSMAGLDKPFPLNSLPTSLAPDFVALQPDHWVTSPDGAYTVCWNVAVDTPLPNTKTIRVLVISTGRGNQKIVPIDLIKAQ